MNPRQSQKAKSARSSFFLKKILLADLLAPWLGLSLITSSGCGISSKAPYYADKNYGRTQRAQVPGEEMQGQSGGSGDAEQKTPPDQGKNPSDKPPQNEDPDKPQNPDDTQDDKPTDPPPPQEAPPPSDKILQKWEYRVTYDTSSVKGLRNSSPAPVALNDIVADNVRSRLISGPEDGLIWSQNYGDGKGKFQMFYALKNSVADANRPPSAPSISALRTINVSSSSVCKSDSFVCTDRVVLAPLRGQMETLCFLDPATGMPMGYPIAPRPDLKPEGLSASVGTYGPYNVRIFQGDVSCAPPADGISRGPYVTETITAKISPAPLDGFKYLIQSQNQIAPSFGVTMENIRQTGQLVAPYLDETARLNGKITFFINVEQKLFVKQIVESRLSLDVARALGGGLFAGFIDDLVNLDGIMVDLHYEFCRNLLDPQKINHCP